MENKKVIKPSNDYEKLVGKFKIGCAYKMNTGVLNKIEWHCVGENQEGEEVNIIIHLILGIIKIDYGETEYDLILNKKTHLVGSVYMNKKLETPALNIMDILDFLKWEYKLGYV